MYLQTNELVNIEVERENTVFRVKGAVTVRNTGHEVGALYIYKQDTSFTNSHNVLGRVTKGLDIITYAGLDDKILIQTDPESLLIIQMTNQQAEDYLTSKGIKLIRNGYKEDDAIIIEQKPKYTMEVCKEKEVESLGLDPDLILKIEIDDDASPKSGMHFRTVADMVHTKIGRLQILEKTEGMVLLSPIGPKGLLEQLPENILLILFTLAISA